jgi:beta-lactamase regulating signal transducer with metallopeptidase domain/5-hydroxyisourate hydrolase-like protein (transthyretin family)
MSLSQISFLNDPLGQFATASWQAAILGLLVFVVTRLLRDRLEARWRFGLWLVVLARLALPATPQAPWSLFGLLPHTFLGSGVGETAVASRNATEGVPYGGNVGNGLRAVPSSRLAGIEQRTAESTATEPSPALNTPPEPVGKRLLHSLTTSQWLTAIWLAGVAILLSRQACLHARFRRQRRTWHEAVDPDIDDLFHNCRQKLRVKGSVQLAITTGELGPATWGAFRPGIVIPKSLCACLRPEEVRLVLLHELMHVVRRDVLIDRIAGLVVIAHWFNPIAWLALGCMRRERELACDAAVLGNLDRNESVGYGRALVKVAEQAAVFTPLLGGVGVFARDQSLVRRIRMIANYRYPTLISKALGALLLVVLAALGLTDAEARPTAARTVAASTEPDDKTVTATGFCLDKDEKPVSGARVTLYRSHPYEAKIDRVGSELSDDSGRFQFRELPIPPADTGDRTWRYELVITKQGWGSLIQALYGTFWEKPKRCQLGPAATLQGVVTDPTGKPVAGAHVRAHHLSVEALDGVMSTRTDNQGRYAILDMTAGTLDYPALKLEGGERLGVVRRYFDVFHPDYAHARPTYGKIPETVNVVLAPAGIISGQVIDQVTGKPAAGAVVFMQGALNSVEGGGYGQTRTDANGHYQIKSLLAGKYNIWASAPDRACVAVDSFAVEAGKTLEAPNLALIEGAWIEGRLVDAETKKSISGATKDGRLRVGLHGPSRPKSGAAVDGCDVDDQGRFRLRVAPGINYPYIQRSEYWRKTLGRERYQQGIEVRPGEAIGLEFRILPTEVPPDTATTPDTATIVWTRDMPRFAEREMAAVVRRLGGWYELGKEDHIVEVNMVYHEGPNHARFDNDLTDTDEALRAMWAFPRLKKLFLKKRQATNDGLSNLTKLKELEILSVWDATEIRARGLKHIVGLPNLKTIHMGNGELDDECLAIFGQMPGLTELSLQGNRFTDEGLKHLAGLKKLQVLHLGLNKNPITEAGIRHLANLMELVALDLQWAQVTDESIADLKKLKKLHTLWLNSLAITDAGVDQLLEMKELRDLMVSGTSITERGAERLLKLPNLKTLTLPGKAISEERRNEMRQQRPGLKINFF